MVKFLEASSTQISLNEPLTHEQAETLDKAFADYIKAFKALNIDAVKLIAMTVAGLVDNTEGYTREQFMSVVDFGVDISIKYGGEDE